MLNLDGTPIKKYSPGSRKDNSMSLVYYSPMRTWGNKKSSVNGSKEVRCQAEGAEVHWVEDRNGGRAQQFPAAKGKWKAP